MKDQNYRKFLSKILIPLKSKISVNDFGLDYGCGYSPTLVDILRKNGFAVDFYDPFFFPNKHIFLKKYKFITCSEVVEHFLDPYKEFKKINSLLDNSAWFAVMTSFFNDDITFENWYYRKDPTHIVFYNKKTFHIISQQNNWLYEFPTENIVLFKKK